MDFFFRLQDHCLHYRFLLILFVLNPSLVFGADTSVPEITYPWWIWPLILLVVTFLMGIVAVLGGEIPDFGAEAFHFRLKGAQDFRFLPVAKEVEVVDGDRFCCREEFFAELREARGELRSEPGVVGKGGDHQTVEFDFDREEPFDGDRRGRFLNRIVCDDQVEERLADRQEEGRNVSGGAEADRARFAPAEKSDIDRSGERRDWAPRSVLDRGEVSLFEVIFMHRVLDHRPGVAKHREFCLDLVHISSSFKSTLLRYLPPVTK